MGSVQKWIYGTTFRAGFLGLAFAVGIAPSRADYLWNNETEKRVWGEVVSLSNDHIDFRVGCSGPVRRVEWKEYVSGVTFVEGCSETELSEVGGEPMDCSDVDGRLFQLLNSGREDYVDFVDYTDGVLTVGVKDERFIERSPRRAS